MTTPSGKSSRGDAPLSAYDREHVRVLPKPEWLSRPNPPASQAELGGHMRLAYRGLAATNSTTTLVVVPVGQSSPTHASKAEHVITVLEGAFEFDAEGEIHRLEPLDQIFLPTAMAYGFRNVALQISWFLSVLSPVETWS